MLCDCTYLCAVIIFLLIVLYCHCIVQKEVWILTWEKDINWCCSWVSHITPCSLLPQRLHFSVISRPKSICRSFWSQSIQCNVTQYLNNFVWVAPMFSPQKFVGQLCRLHIRVTVFDKNCVQLSKLAEVVLLLTCIWEMPHSNLIEDTDS